MRILVLFILMSLINGFSPSPGSCQPEGVAEFLASRQVVATVYFAYGSSRLNAGDISKIEGALPELRDAIRNGKIVRVEGFSSPEGKRTNNLRLSLDRAGKVAAYLNSKGLPAEVKVTGFGNLNVKQSRSALERRVEIAAYRAPVELMTTHLNE